LNIEKINDIQVSELANVKVTTSGHIVEVMYMERKSKGNHIVRINSNQYLDKLTGEVKDYQRTENRSQSKNELRKTFKKLRDIVNCNVSEPKNCRWVTLTYSENMTDAVRLYRDCEKLIKKLRYRYGKFEYIQVAEPQGRGAWHIHMVMIFDSKAPYIENKAMSDIWGNGFTKTQKMDNNDNLGAYLSAYLGDVEFDSIKNDIGALSECVGLEVKEVDGKKYIKGGRLHMYPTNFNIYRCSRGIKRPLVEQLLEHDIKEKVSAGTLTFQKTIKISDDDGYENTINYRYYNMKRDRTKY